MKREAYAAARTIAPRLHEYFECCRDEALRRGDRRIAPLPDVEMIETLIDAAFWASLRREEGYVPRISLAFLSPQDAHAPLLLDRPFAVGAAALTRVSPAVIRPGIHLGVWRDEGELRVWGATRVIPALCFVLEVAGPGLLVIKHYNGEETRKFINVAVLEGDQIKLVEHPASAPVSPPVLKSLLHFDSPTCGRKSRITLVQLAVAMREHGRGGLLLIVPESSGSWKDSILHPMPYAVKPSFTELSDLNREPNGHSGWQRDAGPAIEAIGGLTAVDGATILNSRFELLGFGAKIAPREGFSRVEQVIVTEPILGAAATLVHPDQLGGTRHLSAAQFVHDQRDAVALVASQDGRFTVFEWSDAEASVRAHRIETLLL